MSSTAYLFSEVARRLNEYKAAHPEADVVRMDIGDVTLPIAGCVVSAMHRAVEDMADATTFHEEACPWHACRRDR